MQVGTTKTRGHSQKAGNQVTIFGAIVNCVLIFLKLAAGIYGHSQALIADAVHSLSDLVSDGIVLFGLKMGRKPADEKHHFGHARIETLASAFLGLLLIATAVYIGVEAGLNIYRHGEHHPTMLALYGAAASILAKESLYHYTVWVGKRIKSQLVIANAWHHRSDALSSVAVLLGVGFARLNPNWHVLDAYAALLVSFFIVKVGLDILKSTLAEFTDTAPPQEVLQKITGCALSVPGVINTHDLRVRTSGGLYQLEIHVVVDGDLTVIEGHRIAKRVERCLTEDLEDLDRAIVHVDPIEEHRKNT